MHGVIFICSLLLALAPLLGGCGSASMLAQRGEEPTRQESPTTGSMAEEAAASDWKRRLAQRAFFEGSSYQMRGEYDEALVRFRRALRLQPEEPAFHFAMARCHQLAGRADSALHHILIATAADSQQPDLLKMKGELLVANGRAAEAQQSYERLVAIAPDDLQARYTLARLSLHSAPQRAVEHLKILHRQIPDDLDLAIRLVDAQTSAGDTAGATATILEILARDPSGLDNVRLGTDLLISLGRFDEALAARREVLTTVPAGEALESFLLDDLYRTCERLDDRSMPEGFVPFAVASVEMIRAYEWSDAQGSFRCASALLLAGVTDEADALFRAALGRRDAPRTYWLEAAALYAAIGGYERGVRTLLPSARRFPDDAEVARVVGHFELESGRRAEAERWLTRAAKIAPTPDVLEELGTILYARGDMSAGERAFVRAIAIDPDNAGLHASFARALLEHERDLNKALSLAERAIEIDPANGSYLETAGAIALALGRNRRAADLLERALHAQGHSDRAAELLARARSADGSGGGQPISLELNHPSDQGFEPAESP